MTNYVHDMSNQCVKSLVISLRLDILHWITQSDLTCLKEYDEGNDDDDDKGIESEDPCVEFNLVGKLLHQQHTEIPAQGNTNDNRRQGDDGNAAQEEALQFSY